MNNYKDIIITALNMRKMSYSPYSKFSVGAALLTKNGKIFTGCNIENAAYSPSNCAERTAFFKAVSEGERDFTAIAVAGGSAEKDRPSDYCAPCGVCRQVMVEFTHPEEFDVILAKDINDFRVYKLKDLLPESFSGKSL